MDECVKCYEGPVIKWELGTPSPEMQVQMQELLGGTV
jgi:hypothetical protein